MSRSLNFGIGLVLGIILGAVIIYGNFNHQISDYSRISNQLDDTQSELSSISLVHSQLNSNFNNLEEDYEDLEEDYEDLEDDYSEVSSSYSTLQRDYQILETNLGSVEADLEYNKDNWRSLSNCVSDYMDTMYSYTNLEESFTRVINTNELSKISDKIETVSKNEDYNWDAYWWIHKYVRDEVQYVYDPEIPQIGTYTYYGQEDSPLYSDFDIRTGQNLIQSLEYTIEYEQGDCDDQAMLEYSMIQYYRKYIHGSSYSLYLARISFDNGDLHLAVFMPVTDGNICILDPAGNYQTGTWYGIQSKKAGPELYDYEDHWEDDYGGIDEITLWSVDIDSGNHYERFKGSLSETVVFFSN